MNDIERYVPLGELDPASRSPKYWDRFHDDVLRAAGPELARRRTLPLTVSGILHSWSRLLVPGAAVAAAVAGLLLVPSGEADENGILFGIEDILREEAFQANLAPVFLANDPFTEDAFVFAVEGAPGGGDR
jgi:hypothetical protein